MAPSGEWCWPAIRTEKSRCITLLGPAWGLLFGSTLQPLAAWPWFPRDVDDGAVYRYFTHGYVPSPDSIFRDTE